MKKERFRFSLPIRIKISKNKFMSLNLNQYRNAHHMVLNTAKKNFKRLFQEKYGARSITKKEHNFCYRLEYTIYFPNSRRVDVANVGCVVDKFAADALVESGYIVDDDRKHVKEVSFIDGGIDKADPRAELKVYAIKRKER